MAAAVIDELRARIRAIEGAPSVRRRRWSSGVLALDEAVGGLPCPGIAELIGPEGSGRARIALAVAAAHTRAGRWVAWIDPAHRLYPPAAADHGVQLDRLLMVRPAEDGSAPWAWATEQLMRSGRFPLVVVDLPARGSAAGGDRVGLHRAGAHGWARAAERGACTGLILTRRSVREIPADLRIGVGAGRWVVLRDRLGPPASGERELPPWPAIADPRWVT